VPSVPAKPDMPAKPGKVGIRLFKPFFEGGYA